MVQSVEWRGQRDTSRRRLWTLLLISVLAHVPLTPVAALLGLLVLISRAPESAPEEDLPGITAIPVDLIADEGPAAGDPAKEPDKAKPPGPKDEPDKPVAELEPEDEKAPAKPKTEDKPTPETVPGGIPDPVAMAGSAAKITDSNANVRLLIFTDRIRSHPLGNRIGELLGAADQWQDFFGTGGLDPIRDVDRILIAGPQLRDSSEVIAVLRHSSSPAHVRAAVDALVKRDPQGKWLDGNPPAAKARADRAERVFVLASPRIIVVAPPSAATNVIKQAPSLRFPEPKGSEALTTYVVTPWRAFVGIPFEVPKSILWVRMKITATSDGGATAEIVAKDGSAQLATQNAEKLTTDINRVTQLSTGAVGALFGLKKTFRVIEPVSFTAKGDEIHGTVVATPRQLGALLETISNIAKDIAAKNAAKKKAAAAAAADAGSAATGADAGAAGTPPATKPDAAPAQE